MMIRATLRTHNGRKLWFFWFLYSLACLLVSLHLSTATFNPLYNPQKHYHHHHHHHHQSYYYDHAAEDIYNADMDRHYATTSSPLSSTGSGGSGSWDTQHPRGGSTMVMPTTAAAATTTTPDDAELHMQQQSYVPQQSQYHPHYDDYNHNDHQQQLQHEYESQDLPHQHSSPPPQEQHQEEPFHPPRVLLNHVAMALRVTCEWNRRLFAGVHRRIQNIGKKDSQQQNVPSDHDEIQQHQHRQQEYDQQHYHPHHQSPPEQQHMVHPTSQGIDSNFGSRPVNINPRMAWNRPIRERSSLITEEDLLTVFHAKTPYSPSDATAKKEVRRGVARWGQELLPYLETVVDLLGIRSDGFEIPLAMIYLDRACSVDTTRSNGCPPCPFCMPRSVHRLSLVALLLAAQAVDGRKSIQQYIQDIESSSSSLGIPSDELEQMVAWMQSALGDDGLFVSVGQMKEWGEEWDSIFATHIEDATTTTTTTIRHQPEQSNTQKQIQSSSNPNP